MRFGFSTLVMLTLAADLIHGQGRNYGRSMVISQQGIVATSQVLASQAGAQILAKGGSAVDAAIAANAVLGVMEPMMCGLGGDMFAIYWDAKSGKLTGINASGPAPRALNPEFLQGKGIDRMPADGIHSVTVPGAVDGWYQMHKRFGKLAWKELFQSAIAYAENGYPMPEGMHEIWSSRINVSHLAALPDTKAVFLPDGAAPATGQLFRNPEMAKAFRLIAEHGRDAYYKGEIAAAILATSKAAGGTMTAEDLASFSAEWVTPISIDYRGWRIYELPPNGQGMAALEMLNIMETAPPSRDGATGSEELHKRIEAMKLSYSDLHRYNGDPRTSDIPVAGLISKDFAKKRAALIDAERANCDVKPGEVPKGDTTYLTVADKDGNIVSWIQSIYGIFGSRVTTKGMGFILQNRGAGFTLEPKSPNVLAGGKRPFHTIIPGFMEKGDEHIGFGIMNGAVQPLAHAQFVSNLVDYGMNVQAALEAPRFSKANANGCNVSLEDRIPVASLQQLSRRGHLLQLQPEYIEAMGRGQAIMHDSKTKTNYAGSDPRADGAAIPQPVVP